MSKKLIAISIAVLLIGLFSTVAMAGVEGEFTTNIWLIPQTASATEAGEFDIDFQGQLDLDVTLSGLTFSNDLALGLTGIEHYIAGLETTLGALSLKDEFVFATPFIGGNDLLPYFATYVFFGRGPASGAWVPFFGFYGDPQNMTDIGDLLFVKKRVTAEMTLAGLTVENLVIFEDINFPLPWQTSGSQMATGGTYDDSYVAGDQEFGFGDVITISGETVSGITITSKAGMNVDFRVQPFVSDLLVSDAVLIKRLEAAHNAIKKAYWSEAVQSTSFEFTKELIEVEGISPLPAMTVNSYLLFKPDFSEGMAMHGYLNVLYDFGIGQFNVWLDLLQPAQLELEDQIPSYVDFTIGDNLEILWLDRGTDGNPGSNLTLDEQDRVLAMLKFALQGAEFENTLVFQPGVGIHDFLSSAVVGPLTVKSIWTYDSSVSAVTWDSVYFDLSVPVGEATLNFDSMFDLDGLQAGHISITYPFSL